MKQDLFYLVNFLEFINPNSLQTSDSLFGTEIDNFAVDGLKSSIPIKNLNVKHISQTFSLLLD